jgi:hypothetical protein
MQVGPYHNPTETYQYYNLPFCQPADKSYKLEDLGEVCGDLISALAIGTRRCRCVCLPVWGECGWLCKGCGLMADGVVLMLDMPVPCDHRAFGATACHLSHLALELLTRCDDSCRYWRAIG